MVDKRKRVEQSLIEIAFERFKNAFNTKKVYLKKKKYSFDKKN
jgi:hypothetical protein